ncbi:Cof-type HAD-IIB family hydrolase [Paenibacillus shunpengii]|uniref:Cof-type HAD-IIB family hydrolase n=1 Tax=Paenibacillus shunpengii TaxID=2054424 RepID=A0ABW5SUT4_9BACL
MYKLLALDMDGTLLDPSKRITESVHASLRALMNKDILVTIASGRFPASVWLHAQAADMNARLIALNGAVIMDEASGELIHGIPLPAPDLLRLVHLAESRGAYVHFYGYNVLYVKELNEMNMRWPLANVVVQPDKPLTEEHYQEQAGYIQVQPVGDLHAFARTSASPIYKATVICDSPDQIEGLMDELYEWGCFTITRTGRRRFDVNAQGVCKRAALEHVTRYYSLHPSEVAAAGDYDNDLSMLQWAGLGIAMGNAKDSIKQAADVVTLSNEEDGITYAVKNYLLPTQSKYEDKRSSNIL